MVFSLKKKTVAKIVRRIVRKPFHYIDTSVLIENLIGDDTSQRQNCERYLKRIGKDKPYMGCISLFVTGEYLRVALEKQEEQLRKQYETLQETLRGMLGQQGPAPAG